MRLLESLQHMNLVRSGVLALCGMYAPVLIIPATVVMFAICFWIEVKHDRQAKRDHAAALARWEQQQREPVAVIAWTTMYGPAPGSTPK